MDAVVIVTVLALLQFIWFGYEVGIMRARHQCKAPAVTGAPEFERMFRVQQNTMEQLVIFLPALWLFGSMVEPLWAAGLGVFYLVGRTIYRISYVRDPRSRSMGFMLTYVPTLIMLIWILGYTAYSYVGRV